jgi:flagellar motor switch/type III secretory pathway protein FliN
MAGTRGIAGLMAGGALTVRPFDLGSCPPVSGADAAATRAVARTVALLPGSWQASLPPLGDAVLAVAGIDTAPAAAGSLVLGLGRGRERGWLTLAQPFAARLTDAALGGRGAFSAARALGPAERGVLVALLAPALDAIGWALEIAPPRPALRRPAIAVGVEGPFGIGTLWLDLPAGGDPATAPWRQRAAALPIEACVELAATALGAGDLARLAAGDAVVFDGIRFATLAPDADWAAELAIGVHRVPLQIDARGALTLAGDFRLTAAPDRPKVDVRKEGPMDVSGPTEMATAALAAAPIEIVAELGRITLRGDEVLGLVPGVVLAPTVDRRRAVVLRAGGEVWAEGELVDVDGEVGVRVTRLLRP